MTLPTNEQLNEAFEALEHTDKETERVWFWNGIAAYSHLVSEQIAKDLNLDSYEKGGKK